MKRLIPGLVLGLLASSAAAEPFLARETARVGNKGEYSIGVFAPLTYGIANGLELRTHPLLFLVSPNLDLRVAHGELRGWKIAGEYGASVPTPVMKLTQGYLFPTTGQRVGWFVVPHAGGVASRGDFNSNVLSLSADLAVGVPLSRNDIGPLGAPAFLETELAPVTSGYRFQVGGIYDRRLTERWRARGHADLFVHGSSPSPVTLRAGANVDFRVGKMSRVSLGLVWWNSGQHAIDKVSLQRVRSNDFLPSIDFIWAG